MSDIVQEVTLELVPEEPGKINITYGFTLPDHLTEFTVEFGDEISEARGQGFEIRGQTCEWTGNTRNPSIRVGWGVDDGSRRTGYGYVDTGTWAITRLPNISWSWRYGTFSDSPQMKYRYRVAGDGAVSTDGAVAYLGPHDPYTRRSSTTGEDFHLVVPQAAELVDEPDQILEALSQASDLIEIGALNDRVLAIAAPTDGLSWAWKGRQRGDDGFWVRDDATTSETNEAWVHEYVHTRQRFHRTDSTFWFQEGTADYLAALAALERGDISFSAFHRFLSSSADSNAVLTDTDTWQSRSTAYRQGRRACAALDVQLREHTDGARTLMHVLERLNENAEPGGDVIDLSNDDIKKAVQSVTNRGIDGWFNTYVQGSRAPAIPDEPDVFFDGIRKPPSPEPDPTPEPEPEPEPDPTPEPEPEPEPDPTPEPASERPCPVCGMVTSDRFCPTCGHEVNDGTGQSPRHETGTGGKNQCPICGMTTTDHFCPTCGYEFDSPTGGPPEPEPPPEPTPEPTGRRQCPVCDTTTIEMLCPTCGYDLAPRCPVCNSVGEPDEEHCATCGERLRESA